MIDRKEIKSKAKIAFKANYWKCVLVGLIASIFTGAAITGGTSNASESISTTTGSEDLNALIEENPEAAMTIAVAVLAALLFLIVVTTVIGIFLNNPIKLGCDSFFLKNADDSDTGVGEIKTGFKPSYGRNVWAMFLKGLLIALGCILFIIPGFIVSLQYRLLPYILAENPDMKAKDALRMSKEMMKGHKWEAFVLDLSFIGWYFLGGLTLGILMVLYVNPYVSATDAEYYKKIKEAALQTNELGTE